MNWLLARTALNMRLTAFQTTLAFLPGHPHFVVFLPNLNPFLASQIHRPNSSNWTAHTNMSVLKSVIQICPKFGCNYGQISSNWCYCTRKLTISFCDEKVKLSPIWARKFASLNRKRSCIADSITCSEGEWLWAKELLLYYYLSGLYMHHLQSMGYFSPFFCSCWSLLDDDEEQKYREALGN